MLPTAEEVFRDFKGRRAGLVRALTTDVDKFYKLCDPGKENLCLYGHPNATWEVTLPDEALPPVLPEPVPGINYARDRMNKNDWLVLIADHSDAWLLALAFYFGACFGFDKEARRILFQMISSLPTIYEVVTGIAEKQSKEKTLKNSSKRKKTSSKIALRHSESHPKASKMAHLKEEENAYKDEAEEDADQENSMCGSCGDKYVNGEFWICCDACERWFHGKCVRITAARAELIKQYNCPGCTHKRARGGTITGLVDSLDRMGPSCTA